MNATGMMLPRGEWRLHQSKKFALFLACASMVMLFAAFTSAYVVRKAAGNWLEFRLPDIFLVSTVIILASSATAHLANRSYRAEQVAAFRRWTLFTVVLGLLFVVTQYLGWQRLVEIGVPLNGNPSGSFVYVISGFHAAHVLGGIVAWLLILRTALRPFRVSAQRRLHLELTSIYWHFVDALWVYLLLFFILQ